MAYLSDSEKRLLLSALSREKTVCKSIDDEMKGKDSSGTLLVPIVNSLERKFSYDRFEKDIRNKAYEKLGEKIKERFDSLNPKAVDSVIEELKKELII